MGRGALRVDAMTAGGAWRHLVRARWAWMVGVIGGLGTVAGAFASVLQIVPSPADLTPVFWAQLKGFANDQVVKATAAFDKRVEGIEVSLSSVDDQLLALNVNTLGAQLGLLNANRPQLDALRAANPQSDLLRIQLDDLDKTIAKLSKRLDGAQCQLDKRTTSPWLMC